MNTGLYAKEYNEVKELGAIGSVRTAEQQALADFFQPHAVDMFVRSLRTYAYGQNLSLPEQARFLGHVSLALADAAITCWNDKAHWGFWRRRRRSGSLVTTATPRPPETPVGRHSSRLRRTRTTRPVSTA